ncbi:MAG: hypothetical protein M1818_000117 [Claussenomyces sp. TS43310]|nr:MAG: hypothetical protein M1818_000117 [Claussenomyces sp. TS43310]
MAAPPSATSLQSSAEAFKYPLPTVRQIHKQLHSALEEKNARLRALVGGSYRQLLGTAEMIVDMRRDIEIAEEKLGSVAEGCGRNAISKRVAGLGKLGSVHEAIDASTGSVGRLGWLARMKALNGCVIVFGRLLKGRGGDTPGDPASRGRRLVTAAKVSVLSRLLLKSLSDDIEGGHTGAKDLVEETGKKIGALRRRLRRSVERMLERVDGDREGLAQALSAYSLATSSGAKDALNHFLRVRGEALALAFEVDGEVGTKHDRGESMTHALSLYTRSLLDVQALVPRRLSDALLALKGRPLLQDKAIRELEELRLDVCEKWFGDEIVYFSPYIRHDDLDGTHAVETLQGWARKASEVLLQGFQNLLDNVPDFKTLVDVRTNVYEIWIREGGKAKGFDSSIMLDRMRKVVNIRMDRLLKARVSKLHLVGTEIKAAISSTPDLGEKAACLWEDELLDMEFTNGAGRFKQSIISHVHGRNDSVSRAATGYRAWRALIDELFTIVDTLKKQRWDDDLEDLEDDDSLEDRNTLLSKDDPAMLQDHIESSLKHAFDDLQEKLATIMATYKESEHKGSITIFILRVIRDIRAELPESPDLRFFGLSLIPGLHQTLAAYVSAPVLPDSKQFIPKRKKVIGRALWEGSPELPVQPSPATFKLLQNLSFSMMNAGSDLWSTAAVTVFKRHLCDDLVERWVTLLDVRDDAETAFVNGSKDDDKIDGTVKTAEDTETDSDPKKEQIPELEKRGQQDLFTQTFFDLLILKHCLWTLSAESMSKLEERLRCRIDLSATAFDRLQRGAEEYWKRTSLLFGLLA